MGFSFRGGVHPDSHKELTAKKPLEALAAPAFVRLPMRQHVGSAAVPVVAVGERVLLGQIVGDGQGKVSSHVHATVSGEIMAVGVMPHPLGGTSQAVVIKNDYRDEPCAVDSRGTLATLSAEEIINAVRKAGVVGLGGAAFPTYVKLRPPVAITSLIINCSECEPYITSGFRAMLEYTAEIITGVRLVMKALGVQNATIALEANKLAAAEAFEKLLPKGGGGIKIKIMRTKYPQGGERQLIRTVTGKHVPYGSLPSAVGCVVFNPETCLAVYNAVYNAAPLLTRNVTVSGGAVANPKNLLVRIGTPISDLISAAGGFVSPPDKVILGGPMMGTALYSLDTPVIKSTNAVLGMYVGDSDYVENPECLRCGKCVSVCPMRLAPVNISLFYLAAAYEELENCRCEDCIECGCCSYICPARLHLTQTTRAAKQWALKRRAGNG